MSFIDFDTVRATADEAIMLDRVDIMQPTDKRDAVFNESTGSYQDVPADALIAADVHAMIREEGGNVDTDLTEARQRKHYTVNMPATTPAVDGGMQLVVTASVDPLLIGVTLVIDEVVERTVLVMRTVRAWRRVDAITAR